MAEATITASSVAETPTQAPAVAPAPLSTKDKNGRAITLRKLSVLQSMQLLKLLGGNNDAYYQWCMNVARVADIGGEGIAIPQSEMQIEATAQKLGDEGVAALMRILIQEAKEAELTRGAEAERDTVKNS